MERFLTIVEILSYMTQDGRTLFANFETDRL
jgi:hypothetical protein